MKLRWCQAAGGAKCRISKFPAIFNFIQKDAVVCCIKVSTKFRRTQYSEKVFKRLGHKTYTNDTNRRICLRGGSCMTLQLQTTNGSKTDCFWFSVVHKWHHQFCKCKSAFSKYCENSCKYFWHLQWCGVPGSARLCSCKL